MKGSLQKAPSRVLIYRLGHLGDTLISLPALQALRQAFPDSKISLLSNSYSDAARVSPQTVIPPGLIDEWLTYESNEDRTHLSEMAGLLIRLLRKRFDVLVYLAPRIRSERDVRRDLLFFRLARIPRVIGHLGFEPLPVGKNGKLPAIEHEADHLLARLSMSGISIPTKEQTKIDLGITLAEQHEADDWLGQRVSDTKVLIGFAPGSKWPSKVWHEQRFAEVGKRLIDSHDVLPVVFGGSEDRDLGARLIQQWGRGLNAAGELSVRLAAAALSRCSLYVGNDTGTMHLAASVNIKCVAIMPALDWPGHWNPYGDGHFVLRRSVPCEGCLLQICDKEGMRCLTEISVDDVMKACEAALAEITPPRGSVRERVSALQI